MAQAFYRKYRSRNLEEVVGQEHITKALKHALGTGRISHAYLFTGPRGSGKTSVARILAHEVNGLSYEEGMTHLDIIEIDAASNRRIDEIRDLRDKVHIAPTSSKFKVYIIDEVHMLTREAFNALLKTLEEPPQHVIFILATTEVHKLPETIVSRTQRYTFKPVGIDKVVKHLAYISKQEKIKVSPDALKLIAEHGEGSFRDSISLLDQAGNHTGAIELSDIQAMLGIAPESSIHNLLESIIDGDPKQVVLLLASMRQQGFHAPNIAKQLIGTIRQNLLDGTLKLDNSSAVSLMQKLLLCPASPDPETSLELTLIETCIQAAPKDNTPTPTPRTPIASVKENVTPQKPSSPNSKSLSASSQSPTTPSLSITKPTEAIPDDQLWAEVLKALRSRYNTLYGIAKTAVPDFDGVNLQLRMNYPFHQKRLSEPRNKQILYEITSVLAGKKIEIEVIHEKVHELRPLETPQQSSSNDSSPPAGVIDAISNIFGGAEVLES